MKETSEGFWGNYTWLLTPPKNISILFRDTNTYLGAGTAICRCQFANTIGPRAAMVEAAALITFP
jgi:hypothetical protein